MFLHLLGVPKLSSYAKAEDKLFKYLFGNYQKWVRPVEYLNQTIRVKFGLAISQLVDVVRIEQHWLLILFINVCYWGVKITTVNVKRSRVERHCYLNCVSPSFLLPFWIEILTWLLSHPSRMRKISEWQPMCGWNRQVELYFYPKRLIQHYILPPSLNMQVKLLGYGCWCYFILSVFSKTTSGVHGI